SVVSTTSAPGAGSERRDARGARGAAALRDRVHPLDEPDPGSPDSGDALVECHAIDHGGHDLQPTVPAPLELLHGHTVHQHTVVHDAPGHRLIRTPPAAAESQRATVAYRVGGRFGHCEQEVVDVTVDVRGSRALADEPADLGKRRGTGVEGALASDRTVRHG